MSSLGGQWRVIRHYLSLSNLNAEVEKLLQRIKPASPDQWDNLIQRFEKAISVRLMRNGKELEVNKSTTVKTATVEDATKIGKESQEAEKREEKPSEKASLEGMSVGSAITVEGLLQGIKRRKDLHFGKVSESGWKSNKPVVNKTSIHSRTAYVISALVSAESAACVAKRAEDFIHHVHQYPETRDYAVKEGAVRALLRVQQRLRAAEAGADEVRGIVNEALALVGYAGAPRGPGPRILALDGGGIRGLVAIEVLRHLERLTGRRVNELFDYIIGVSTGAIIAAVIGSGVGTLETASKMYVKLSKEMFGNTSVIGGTSRLVWTHSYYDTALWEKMLRDNFGEITLTQCNRNPDNPKMALVSCVVNSGSRPAPFVFRTYAGSAGARGTSGARVWAAVRASAAAPTYFDEFRLRGLVLQDGGIVANNPAGVGLREARLLYGARALRRAALVSLGTGRAPLAPRARPRAAADPAPAPTSWRDKFDKILDSATDTEGVHLLLNELLPAGSYYRFNPPLTAPCAMDEIDPARLQAMLDDTAAYLRRNQHKLREAAAALTRRRSWPQRAADALQRRALLLGLTGAR